ncbi:MAG: TonB-dependent receptor [Cytophagales bacterium]|nr:MAG: TonB-dependent receptor [Cytophagales bacterium]
MTLVFWVFSLFGFTAPQDTVALAEVEVYAPALDRFAQGQKVISFEKKELEGYSARSLGDLLQEKSPVFVRQYGAGMLASPSFRGTSAGHTAVFWNGLPINSISLGQSDLSILPIQAIDQAEVHFGSSGALFGNEAIGGSVHLGTQSRFGQGFRGQLSQTFGSFGLSNSAFSAGFSGKNFSTQTKLYRQFARNDFPFQDLSKPGTPEIRAENAQTEQVGWVQDLAWNLSEKSQFKASIWWNRADRQIQPVMGSATRDEQQDQSWRAVVDYFRFGAGSVWNIKAGWVTDQLIFNGSENRTRLFLLATDWDVEKTPNWTFKIGARSTFARGELSTYSATDQRIELYQSAKWTANQRLSISANFRQLAYQDQLEPFLPGLGMDFLIWGKGKNQLSLKASAGRGFKVPTLNDRFWNPGGNPDLLPEKSQNGEVGFRWNRKSDFSWEQSLTYYRMQVDNWIIWLPQGAIWSPQNIREVRNQGLEYQGKGAWKTGQWNWQLNGSYNFSQALDLTSDSQNPQQLPYTPEHQANGSLEAESNGLTFNLSTFYVGQRTIGTGNARVLEGYQLWNAGFSFSRLQWKKLQVPISFQVLNLFDREYQVLYLRAMPGRSYQFNLTLLL